MIYVLLALLIFFFIYGITKKNNKVIYPIFIVLFLICYISKSLPDMENYSDYYNEIGIGKYNTVQGIGFLYLCIIGNKLKLSYNLFKSILYLISLFLTYSTIKMFSSKKLQVFGLYLLFPGLLDLIQIRFFFATSLAIFAIGTIIKTRNKLKFVFSCFILLLACLFHTSCLFYLIFIFMPVFRKFKIKSILKTSIFLTLFSLFFSNYFLESFLYKVLPESQYSRINAYFSLGHISLLALIVYCGMFALQIVVSFYLFKQSKKINYNISFENKNIIRDICIINIILFLSIPFVFFTSDFLRLQRPFLLINYCLYYRCYRLVQRTNIRLFGIEFKSKIYFWSYFLIYVLLFIFAFNYQSVLLLLGL